MYTLSLSLRRSLALTATLFFFVLPFVGLAQDKPLIVPIGGETSSNINPATYVSAIYRWGVGLAALLALAELVYGAVEYTASAGNVGSREGAVTRIRGAILGLVLLLAASVILRTIDSDFGTIRLAGLDNSSLVAERQTALLQTRDERLADLAAAWPIPPEDYLAIKDVLDFRDADGKTPIENADELAVIKETNQQLMSQYLAKKNALIAAGESTTNNPVLTALENELVAALAEEKARMTQAEFADVISDLNVAERKKLFTKYKF